jgi:protein gp37
MSINSDIEWTNSTWNPVTGCTRVSAGCKNCYAEKMSRRLKLMRNPSYSNGFEVTLHEHILPLPLKWKKPRMVFVNSMGDLFHRKVPKAFIRRVFDVMNRADRHTFQLLTKRSERLAELAPSLPWRRNIWLGVTVEDRDNLFRIDHLRRTGATTKFLSVEPLLGPLGRVDLRGIDWVILGGESGPGARPMDSAWVTDVRDQCVRASVPFFFKQWGGTRKKKAGRLLEDRAWDEMPAHGETEA